ncbi:MAG TPA: low affinity iron permease family protein [Solirubrobacteraceae bacterium]|nr:low affinity iron permease family protein [Solirubrobacteraceae bacterium]
MTTRHPTERADGESRSRFNRVAEAASNFSSSPTFFGLCLLLIAAWATSHLLGVSNTLRDVFGFGMTALTLMLLALLKNSELRSEHAVQRKLDAIAAALLEERRGQASPEVLEDLEEAVRMHEEV